MYLYVYNIPYYHEQLSISITLIYSWYYLPVLECFASKNSLRKSQTSRKCTHGICTLEYQSHHGTSTNISMYIVMISLNYLSIGWHVLQQKIRRDREKREERRMGGKQQIAKGKLKER